MGLGSNAPDLYGHREGEGEPLVLVHGLGSSWRAWKPILPALAARHDVIALDLPGFGASPPLRDREATVPALADAVEAELEALGVGDAHVAGFSMGGWIALELARRGRIQTAVAIAPAGLGTSSENRISMLKVDSARRMLRVLEPTLGRLTKTAAGRTALYGLAVARPWQAQPDELTYALRVFARSSAFPEASNFIFTRNAEGWDGISCPVTVVWGTSDQILPVRQAERIAAKIPHARVEILQKLGHVPFADDPEPVTRLILETTGGVADADRVPAGAAAS